MTSQTRVPLQRVGRDLRAPRAAGVAGLVFGILFIVALLLVRRHPGADASPAEIAEYYGEDGSGSLGLVGLYLVPFSGIAFLWFIAVIRNRIGDREDQFFGTVFLGSGLLFVAMLFVAAAAAGAPLAAARFQDAGVPSDEMIDLSRGLAYTLLYVYAVKVAAVFMLVVSTIALQTVTLPRWLVFAGYAVAALLLVSVSFFPLIVLLFPGWVALVSIVILMADRVPDDRRAARPSTS
jgi:hypothetical protein